MTNREALILALRAMGPDEGDAHEAIMSSPWEDWATPESIVAYSIACPHHDTSGHPCDSLTWPWSTLSVCGPCKEAWLDEEAEE